MEVDACTTPLSEFETFKPKYSSKHVNWESTNRFALLAGDDNEEVCVDSGATTSIVPNNFKLENETTTPNGIRVHSCTNGVMISSSKGDMNINLPPKARVAHKMNVNQPLLSVGQAANEGCVTVFTKKKVIICDENKIDIQLSASPLVEGDRGRNGLWHVSSYNNKAPVIYCAKTAYTQDISHDLAMYL